MAYRYYNILTVSSSFTQITLTDIFRITSRGHRRAQGK